MRLRPPGLLALFLIALSTATLAPAQTPQGRPGSVLGVEFLGSLSTAQTAAAIGGFYRRAPDAPAPRYGVDRYRLRFRTSDPGGSPLESRALLYIPRFAQATPAPVFVMAPGTTGLIDRCATLLERPAVRNWGNYEAQMLSYAGQGYISILPDYAFYDDPSRYQSYFIAAYNSRVMLDGARAVYSFFGRPAARLIDARPAQRVFLAGYSQGAHTVFAATDIAEGYAPELPLAGAIGFGTTTSVEALMKDSPYFGVYILLAWQQYYGIDPARVLLPRYASGLALVAGQRCVDEIPRLYPNAVVQLYQPRFREALLAGELEAYYPELARRLRENFPGLNPQAQTVPALIVQGGADPISPDRTVEPYARRLCGLGRRLEYVYLPGVHHFYVRQIGFRAALDWMSRVRSGQRPGNCGRWN
ncbi:MAG: lipase family protein [Meiothermus sp.]|nr:lipase family protein [Meiothermus sp.]